MRQQTHKVYRRQRGTSRSQKSLHQRTPFRLRQGIYITQENSRQRYWQPRVSNEGLGYTKLLGDLLTTRRDLIQEASSGWISGESVMAQQGFRTRRPNVVRHKSLL